MYTGDSNRIDRMNRMETIFIFKFEIKL